MRSNHVRFRPNRGCTDNFGSMQANAQKNMEKKFVTMLLLRVGPQIKSPVVLTELLANFVFVKGGGGQGVHRIGCRAGLAQLDAKATNLDAKKIIYARSAKISIS